MTLKKNVQVEDINVAHVVETRRKITTSQTIILGALHDGENLGIDHEDDTSTVVHQLKTILETITFPVNPNL